MRAMLFSCGDDSLFSSFSHSSRTAADIAAGSTANRENAPIISNKHKNKYRANLNVEILIFIFIILFLL
jgi:hypothetical protein